MIRQINNLNQYAYSYLSNEVPIAIESESIDQTSKTATVRLSDNAILKSYDDGVIIEVGVHSAWLLEDDFESIAVSKVVL